MGGFAQLVNCMHNTVHWWAPPSHVVEVNHSCNVVAAHLHCLALEEWEEGLEGIVHCGDFEHADVALLGGHQPAEVWVGELIIAPRDAPQSVREALVLSRTLHGHRFAKWLFHVNRPWRQSSRSKIIAVDSDTKLFQFALWAMLWYTLCRRSLAGRMALVKATPWPITAASFQTGTQPCCLKRCNRQLMLCCSVWDLRGGTLNEGGPVVSTRRPRNSLDWLGVRSDLPAQLIEEAEGEGCMFEGLLVRVANDNEVVHVGHHPHALVAKVTDCCLHKASE